MAGKYARYIKTPLASFAAKANIAETKITLHPFSKNELCDRRLTTPCIISRCDCLFSMEIPPFLRRLPDSKQRPKADLTCKIYSTVIEIYCDKIQVSHCFEYCQMLEYLADIKGPYNPSSTRLNGIDILLLSPPGIILKRQFP